MEYNYDVSVFIIDQENNYIEAKEYIAYGYENGMFVCLTNNELDQEYKFNNSICIYKEWQTEIIETMELLHDIYHVRYNDGGEEGCQWQYEDILIANNIHIDWIRNNNERDMKMKQYLDGYLSCQNIMMNASSLLKKEVTIQEYIPAIMTAHHTKVKHNGKFYNGYLPSIGQLLYISKNGKKVNDVLKLLSLDGNEKELFRLNAKNEIAGNWWSSQEYNDRSVWKLNYGNSDYVGKGDNAKILPLFALC